MTCATRSMGTPPFGIGATKIAASGPVSAAIRIVRDGLDNAVDRLLSEPTPNPFAALSIGALVSLFEAHETAGNVFTHRANAPRVEADKAAGRMFDALAEDHHRAMERVIAELEARTPQGDWERDMRLWLLLKWHAAGEDTVGVDQVLAEIHRVGA